MPDVSLELNYDDKESIPEGFAGLFDEKDGKFVLSGVNGMKTVNDITALQGSLAKERNDHKAAQNSLKAWGELKPEEVLTQLDRIKELEAAAEGKLDETKINEIVEGRITQKTAPLTRQLETVNGQLQEVTTERDALKNQITTRDRNDAVRSVATEMKVVDTAIEDVTLVAGMYLEQDASGNWITRADVQGVTPGVDIKQFMKEMQEKRPHWWPQSQGGGAGNLGEFGGDANPWSAKGWNMTQQSAIVRDKGSEFAAKLAKAAGTTVGGLKPSAK